MKTAFVSLCSRSALALAVGLGWLMAHSASAVPPVPWSYQLRDGGQDRVFDVSLGEVWVQAGTQRRDLRKIVPAASPDAALAAAQAMQVSLGRPAGLVLIERGLPDDDYARAFLTRQVLARLEAPASAPALVTALGAAGSEAVAGLPGWWLFSTTDMLGAPALADALRSQPGVAYAEAQLARKQKPMFVPDDVFLVRQWHLINTGQDGATPGMDVAVTNVWDTYRGNGIVFGIIDEGMEYTHPDLAPNVVPGLGYDWIDHDNDPMPMDPFEAHGTCVGGVAAAKGNNTEGVASPSFNGGLVSERLIGGFFTDADEAGAYLYENQRISIKNNSWGPGADFAVVRSPGPLASAALEQGVTLGRGGRGEIYAFASGNSRGEYGNANFNGMANSRYTVAVTGNTDKGGIVSYATPGCCVNVAAPTGDSQFGSADITTTDRVSTNGYNPPQFGGVDYVNQDYTRTFNGTSSATPLASGVIGLVLEANPNLGWRDVQEIIMRSARVISPELPSWQTNAAGFHFSYDFGAGMIQAEAAVALAQDWVNLAPETNVSYEATSLGLVIPDNNPTGISYDFVVGEPNLRIEHVTLGVGISHSLRGDLEIDLISPSGIVSRMGTPRPYDPFADLNWTFMTVFNWGEDSVGRWTIKVSDRSARDTGVLNDLKLTIYGVPREAAPDASASDLALRIVSAPDPVLVGNTLTYSVTLTNQGMNTASNIVVLQNLPLTTVFLNGSSPSGPVNQVAGLVTWNPADLAPGASATMTVRVLAAVAGTQFSTASVTNSTRDSNLANNTYVVSTRVLPLTADLGLTLSAQPNPALVGGTLNYTMTVTNRGPSLAAGTVVTATLPSTVAITAVNASQGNSTVVSNVVTFNLGGVASAGVASLSIACRPLSPGNLLATARISSNLPDPISANNTASASTAVNPAADLVAAMVDYPDPAVLYSNFYYFIAVTNRGPNPATAVTVNQTIPPGVKVVSNFTSQGSVSVIGGTAVVGSLGTLPVGGSANLVITVAGMNVGTFPSTVTVSSSQVDADVGNNSASVSTEVALPYISIVNAGATLTGESLSTNGALDIGEAVTVQLRLRNAGNVPNTNLVATLLPGGGVTNVTLSPQTYGVLAPGGLPVGRTFGFTAVGTNGGTVTARLQLSDNGHIIGTNTFVFALPRLTAPANTSPIVINDNAKASPYPSSIAVTGLTGVVSKVSVTLNNVNHTYPHDMQVLLVGPGNNRVMLMANAGGIPPFANANVTFDDAAAPMGENSNAGSGSYHPTSYGTVGSLPSPAPATPYANTLSVFNGLVPNGTWSLYIVDTAAGDYGVISNGWNLQLYTVNAVNQLADLGVAASATPNPALVGSTLTFTYTVTNAGPNAANAVVLTNVQPASVAVDSASADIGSASVNGNVVSLAVPTLPAASKATLTVTVKPLAAGVVSASATAGAAEVDLNPANNQASASATAQLPVADLAVGIQPPANTTIVVGSNVTYSITATNLGPQNALSVVLTDLLGARSTNDFSIVSLTNTPGTATGASNSTVVAAWGDLEPGATGALTVTLQANALGRFTNVVSAATGSSDTANANNQAQFILEVVPPMPKLVPAGATLLTESLTPPNGVVDPGETVTVLLALQNLGELTASNVVATLAASGGVTAPGAPQTFGELVPGAAAVARPFTFTASGAGPYTATLMLTNDGASLGTAAFTFYPPTAASAANGSGVFIPEIGTASPYPSAIVVSGLAGVISQVTVTLSNLSHTFPDDLDILLVSPAGTKLMLMSDAGGNYSVSNVTLTFAASATSSLPDNGLITSGTYLPSDYDTGDLFVSPAPDGPLATSLSAFNGQDPNGGWALYLVDDSSGDRGNLAGWGLNFTLVQAINPVSGLSVSLMADPQSAATWQNVTLHSVVANQGSAAAPAVFLTNRLPAGLKFISATASQGTWSNTAAGVVFALGQLDATDSAQLSVVAQPTAGGTQTVTAGVVGLGSTDLDLADNTASVVVTTVAPPPSPTLSAHYQGGLFVLQLKGQPNSIYDLQSAATLPGTWSPVTTLTTDASGNASWSAATQLSPNFYRTVQTP